MTLGVAVAPTTTRCWLISTVGNRIPGSNVLVVVAERQDRRETEGHKLIGQALNNLGWVHSDGLRRYFEQAYSIPERTGGADRAVNPDLGQLVADYAISLRGAGQEEKASALETRLSIE
jgi:hypothetical protein